MHARRLFHSYTASMRLLNKRLSRLHGCMVGGEGVAWMGGVLSCAAYRCVAAPLLLNPTAVSRGALQAIRTCLTRCSDPATQLSGGLQRARYRACVVCTSSSRLLVTCLLAFLAIQVLDIVRYTTHGLTLMTLATRPCLIHINRRQISRGKVRLV